jgi:hypothetical protein
MGKLFLSLFLIFTIYSLNTAAQNNDLSIIVKFGQSNYRINSWSENRSNSIWNNGYQFSLGIEKPLNTRFYLQCLFDYSVHGFDENYAWGEKVNDAKNRIYDLMGIVQLNIGIFYFHGGIGISYQKSDAVRYLESKPYNNTSILYAAKERFVFAGLLGAGLDMNIYKQINLITDVDMNMREYTGTSLLIGVKYSL